MVTRILKTTFLFVLCSTMLILFSCKPVIGTPFYPRAAEETAAALFTLRITVSDAVATPKLASTPKDELHALELYAAATEYMVTVPYSCKELTAENIAVEAVGSLTRKDKIAVEVSVNGDAVPLLAGKTVPLTIKIQDTAGSFGVCEKVIKVTRQEQSAMQQNLELVSLKVHGIPVDSDGAVTVPYANAAVAASDITATFTLNAENTILPVEIDDAPVKLQENKTVEVLIRVKEQAGQYNAFEKKVSILREQKKDDEDSALQLESLSVLGCDALSGTVLLPDMGRPLTPNDVIASFKDFGVLDVTFESGTITLTDTTLVTLSIPAKPGRYLAWETTIRLIKDPTMLVNPEDKHGNKKYTMSVETIEEDIDPFAYYDKNYGGFPASKFDEWVVYISGFNNSTNIASYEFKEGAWAGSPEVYAGPDFGSGLKKMGSVRFYRYASRKDRWSGNEPPLFDAGKEKRFYFYRFTASGGVDLDNSMFCIDTHSKFIFFYSDPSEVSSVGVPSGWCDYADPTKGQHKHFSEPFYLSDPVGFVKENGQVVMYSWIKENITNNNYTAQKNPAFTKPAEQKVGGEGYSPYRYPIKKKYQNVVRTENAAYTAALPVITRQPEAIRINPAAPDTPSFTLRVVQPPEGEQLSYQWYENTIQSDQGGIPIVGATEAAYTPDKTQTKDCYVYCAVTNKNTKNNQTETVRSYAVKLLIKEGSLTVDAEQPRIIQEPKGDIIPINTSKDVKLTVGAASMDKGSLSYQWYKAADKTAAGEKIDGADKEEYSFKLEKTDTAVARTTYYYCEVTNTNLTVDGKKTAVKTTERAAVEIEESYQLHFSAAAVQPEPNKPFGTVTAICNGKQITTGAYIKRGSTVTFFAEAETGYEVFEWTNVPADAISDNKLVAKLTIGSAKPAPVVVTFRKIPDSRRLIITAKRLENVDLCCKYSGWQTNHNPNHAYFVYNLKSQIFDTAASYDPDNYQSLWSIYNGEDATKNITQVSKIRKLDKGEAVTSANGTIKEFAQKPESQFFRLDTKLVKYDKNGVNAATAPQYLSGYGQSVVEFVYNKETDGWTCKKADIPNNFNIPNVEVTFKEDFVLRRGEEKDFTITYYVDNAGNYAVGTARVTYTLKWE